MEKCELVCRMKRFLNIDLDDDITISQMFECCERTHGKRYTRYFADMFYMSMAEVLDKTP